MCGGGGGLAINLLYRNHVWSREFESLLRINLSKNAVLRNNLTFFFEHFLLISFGWRFYSESGITEIPTSSRFFAVVESVIGKNLTCYDFIYVLFQQFYGLIDGGFKAYNISFLVYMLICKIWLTGYVPKVFVFYNLGLQFIMILQIFLIIADYKRENETKIENQKIELEN